MKKEKTILAYAPRMIVNKDQIDEFIEEPIEFEGHDETENVDNNRVKNWLNNHALRDAIEEFTILDPSSPDYAVHKENFKNKHLTG